MKRRAPPCCTPKAAPRSRRTDAPRDDDRTLAAWCKAVGHPARLRILRLLAHRTTCVCGDLVDALPLAQSTVSQHLKVLKEAGLVRGTIDGPRVGYCIDPAVLRRWKTLVAAL